MFKDAYRIGLSTDEFLGMTFEQYNAYVEGHLLRTQDELSLMIQAAYLSAYWNGASKSKKSLQSVLKSIRKDPTGKTKKRKPIDYAAVDAEFQKLEDLKNNGWCKQ